jgi:hypothetical protein
MVSPSVTTWLQIYSPYVRFTSVLEVWNYNRLRVYLKLGNRRHNSQVLNLVSQIQGKCMISTYLYAALCWLQWINTYTTWWLTAWYTLWDDLNCILLMSSLLYSPPSQNQLEERGCKDLMQGLCNWDLPSEGGIHRPTEMWPPVWSGWHMFWGEP